MDKLIIKQKYDPPRVIVATFNVESGFQSSVSTPMVNFELFSSENPGCSYGAASNSGNSFWGGNSGVQPSFGNYSGWEWNW